MQAVAAMERRRFETGAMMRLKAGEVSDGRLVITMGCSP